MQTLDATWPAAAYQRLGPWLLRDGRGGGKRVSAISALGDWTESDIDLAQEAQRDPLFLIRADQQALDRALAARIYARIDPVIAYAAPVTAFPPHDPHICFAHWPPLAIAAQIWDQAGIGPARVQVMDRAADKTALLVRDDRAAGVCFVAMAGETAMVHAVEVAPPFRRRGSAQNLLAAAAHWAAARGAVTLSLVVTESNIPARALYRKLGMAEIGRYHYRQRPKD